MRRERPIRCRNTLSMEAVSSLGYSRKDADAAPKCPPQFGACVAGILQSIPRGLQEQPLLRVRVQCFPRRDSEEQRVELVEGIEKSSPLAVTLACTDCLYHVRVVEAGRVPTPTRNFGDTVPTGAQIAPIFIERGCLGVCAADSDDGYRLAAAATCEGESLPLSCREPARRYLLRREENIGSFVSGSRGKDSV